MPVGETLVVSRLRELGIDVPGTDGLNIWVPVRDESAAVLRLASQGIAVTPGSPFAVESRPGPEGHVRVTTGLVRDGHEELADAHRRRRPRRSLDRPAALNPDDGSGPRWRRAAP